MNQTGTSLRLWALCAAMLIAACGGRRTDGLNVKPDGGGDTMAGDVPGAETPVTIEPTSIDPVECSRSACNASVADLCCPPSCSGATDIDCAGCGNGRIEAGEICDPLETCPTSCPQLKCEKQRLKSEGTCADVCVSAGQQTACIDGDECCPSGCTAANDRDCTAICGNGALEPGELCDPLASCAQTCPMRGCTILTMKDPGTCLAHCVETGQQSACQSDDGCCPAGCTSATDNDCGIVCGNGVVEGKESCDPLASCPTACPAQGCRLRQLVNAGTCAAACIDGGLETQCKGAGVKDGCCAVGCNATNDGDCPVLCGNSVVEAGETCDPIASCMDKERACVSDDATTRVRGGDSGKCSFTCTETPRTCGAADGACPPGCGPTMDRDCRGCGNGVVEPGETCDPVARCREQATACVSDNNTVRTPSGDPAACTFTCTQTPRMCGLMDGACPTGCTAALDPDCVGCGNGRLDPGETCDPVADCQARQKACVSDAGTVRTPMGDPNTCRFVCQEAPRTCGPMDGVCPANCGPTMDRDCPGCGNQRPDPGETCDPCSPADVRACVSDTDFIRTPMGTVAACTFACTVTPRPCAAGDNICPTMCTPVNDPDCRPGPGEVCSPRIGCRPTGGTCTDGFCCVQTCKDCQSCTGKGGSCVNIPSGQPDNVPAGTCVAPNSCNGQGGCQPPACQLQAKPESHDFGNVPVGQSGGVRIAFNNPCPISAQPSVIVSPADFVIVSNGCTALLAPGQSCIVSVSFRPATVGVKTGILSGSFAGGGTTSVPLRGTATPPPAILMFNAPNGVQFPTVVVGNTSTASVLLTNTGGASGPLTIAPSPAGNFTVVAPFCTALATNRECIVHLRFFATKAGPYNAILTATAANGGSAQTPLNAQAINIIGVVGPPIAQ